MRSYSKIAILGAASAAAVALALAGVDWLDTGTARQPVTVNPRTSPPPVAVAEDAARSTVDHSAVGDLAPARVLAPEADLQRSALATDTRSSAMEAVVALADVPGQQAESALASAALGHAEPAVREEAIHSLGERGGAVALQTLQQALQDPSPRVRESGVQAFVAIGGSEAVRVLGSALGAADASTRVYAVDALGQIGGPEAVWYLQQVLGDENAVVREAAAEWLAELSGGG